ncbi:glycoside hydrolase family 65 protein [Lactobacillus selangorensis]|nr:glycosyl hydrolase family 65 protein [Lactobacillus selangorensis]
MKYLTLEVHDQEISGNEEDGHSYDISFTKDDDVDGILTRLADALRPQHFDALVLANASESVFSDTVVKINGEKVDIGIGLTNKLLIPVVSQAAVADKGLEEATRQQTNQDEWHLSYYGIYHDKKEYGQESLLTVGNGFFGLRGSFVEANESKNFYPGTYIAGVYNQLTTPIHGRDVVNEDLVNMPNGQFMTFKVGDGEPFALDDSMIDDVYKSLNFKTGALKLQMIVSLPDGKKVKVETIKYADMKNWHHYAVSYTLTPLNFSGEMTLISRLDGSTVNANVARYSDFKNRHYDITKTEESGTENYMFGETKTSHVKFAFGTNLGVVNNETIDIGDELRNYTHDDIMEQTIVFSAEQNQSYQFTKDVVMFTSLETKGDLEEDLFNALNNDSFASAEKNSRLAWQRIWEKADLKVTGDVVAQKLLRMDIFHAFVTATETANKNLDASVGARGLHGEAYRGHIFWDDLFIMPFYTQNYPNLTRKLLQYRFKRLDAAKKYAKENGYDGAMYPWQSAMYGDEQSQFVHLNPLTNTWDPDNSRLQRHVSLAVAYNIWYYYHQTLDIDFMKQYGMPILLEVAKMWASMAKYNAKEGSYDIDGVMGPDEFHEGYPGAKKAGLNNNAYTNVMVVWLFQTVERFIQILPKDENAKLYQDADFNHDNIDEMRKIQRDLTIEVSDDGIIAQFQGYFKLKPLDLDAYKKKYGDISRIDRILKAQNESPDEYQVAKQADTLQAIYELPLDHFEAVFKAQGIKLPADYLVKNVRYYLARTTHGSTLSRIVYAELALLDNQRDLSWDLFSEALSSDYYDIQGGTTAEGIHLGVMGATIMVTERDYAGVDDRGAEISIDPHMPKQWGSIEFIRLFRGVEYHFLVTKNKIEVTANQDVSVRIQGEQTSLTANKTETVTYD